MIIEEKYVRKTINGDKEMSVQIFYAASETLPTNYAEGSVAYCYDGADKGKVYVFNGTTWVEQ